MRMNARRAVCLGLLLILLFVLSPMTHAAAGVVRVLPPASASNTTPQILCLAEYLSERLRECKGVDVVNGKRAARVCSWLQGGTFDYSEQVLWDRIQAYVPLDGMIEVVELPAGKDALTEGAGVNVEVKIFVATGLKRIKETLPSGPTSDLPRAISKLAERVGRELKLSEADVKILGEVRIPDSTYFTIYYVSKNVWSPWPVNSYQNVMQQAARLPDTHPHWAREAATARAVWGYIYSGTHGRQADVMKQAVSLARMPVIRLLGTGHESEAHPLLTLARDPKTEAFMEDIESVLLQIAKPLGYGKVAPGKADAKGNDADWIKEIDDAATMKPKEKGGLGEGLTVPTDLSARTGKADFTPAEREAALRMLGVMGSVKALDLFKQTAQLADSALREATAASLVNYKDEAGIDLLNTLKADADEKVAFIAARSLWQRKRPPADFRQRAVAMLQKAEPYRTWAAQALAASATSEDQALLDKLANDEAPAVRSAVHHAMYANSSADPKKLVQAMSDPETEIVVAAIKRVPAASLVAGSDIYVHMVRLANDPDNAVAWAARDALWPLRPSDPQGRTRFDLSTASPYLRHKAVGQLSVSKEPWAKAELIAACDNYEAHTRIAALVALAPDAAVARPLLLKAVADPHLLVRLRAASLLAPIADAGQAGAIREAIARQKDRATTLYLQDALARAEGKPLPPPQRAANSILGPNTISWLSPGGGVRDSPYQGYYSLSHALRAQSDTISDENKAAHAAGKAFFARVSPIGNPGTIMVDGLAQDDYWLNLNSELDVPGLPYIDGVVYGEETMSMDGESLWPSAWRFFCDDTGIDPQRVNGDKKNLTPYEAHAWSIWGQRRCVEGFNRLYDYTKLKFGKLHPGFQVCTFLPEQAGPSFADFDWKFDLGGIYHYVGHTRKDAFSLVRRYKTIWPDRPALWLSHGIGVYERTPIQYTHSGPGEPIVNRTYRAYTDALTAWMAGADTGWFSIWAFLPYDWVNAGMASLKGPTISPEDITPESAKLHACVNFAFAGVDKFLHDKDELAKVNSKGMVVPPSAKESKMDSLIETLDGPKGPDAITKKVNQDTEDLYLSFQFYRKHLMDLARLFASLPRNNPKPEVLCVQPGLNVWDGVIGSPGSDLLTYYDFLLDINTSVHLDLNRYKMIAVKDPGALTDETIAKMTKWLKETPGVLYVHLNLTADNAAQYATPEAFDGKLKLDWPWENDVELTAPDAPPTPKKKAAKKAPVAKGETLTLVSPAGVSVTVPGGVIARVMEITGKAARPLLSVEDTPVLAVWQSPDYKGVVVFDVIDGGGKPYREELRKVFAELKEKSGVGIVVDGPQRHEVLTSEQWIANTTAGSTDKNTLTGVDMVTGALNPVVGPGKSAAFVGKNFQGKFAASYNGISVLCDKPIKKVEKIPGGLRIECDGLMQTASVTAKLEVKPESGDALPDIKKEKLNHWVIYEKSQGVAIQAIGDGKESQPNSYYYVRCNRPVTILTR